MSYLATVMFYVDEIDELTGDPEGLVKVLRDHIASMSPTEQRNDMKLFKPRGADATAIYIHDGNTVTEMSPYSTEAQEFMREDPELFKELYGKLRREVDELGRKYREVMSQRVDESGGSSTGQRIDGFPRTTGRREPKKG